MIVKDETRKNMLPPMPPRTPLHIMAWAQKWADESYRAGLAEVEELRTLNSILHDTLSRRGKSNIPEFVALRAEVESLREEHDAFKAALDKIAERMSSDDPCRHLVQIARDALMEKP
jgi:hypothetical protein